MAKGKERKAYDWEAIEKEYRSGQLSIRTIANKHGCAESSIRKKAKENQWERDLSDDVRKKVRNELVRKTVRKDDATDREIVEQAARQGVEVVLSHRRDISRLRELEDKFISELADNPTKLYITQYQGGIVEKEVGIAVTDKTAALNNLANVQHKRIQLERQAFNLDDDEKRETKTTTLDDIISAIDGTSRGLPSHE